MGVTSCELKISYTVLSNCRESILILRGTYMLHTKKQYWILDQLWQNLKCRYISTKGYVL